MSYADGLLSTGERIVHREKQHWFVFVWGARWAVVAMVVGMLVFFLREQLSPDQKAGALYGLMGWLGAALILGGFAVLGWHILRFLTQEYVLTNRRVLQVAGVLNKTSTDSSLEKINDARLSQSVFGRMFGFGDLDILTAAETGIERFRMLRDPVKFKKAMLDAKHEYERDISGSSYPSSPPLRTEPVPVPTAASAAPGDHTTSTALPSRPAAVLTPDELTRTLSSLADLRDRGAISAEDYERKKTDLLGRL